jgi:hypothetical protein
MTHHEWESLQPAAPSTASPNREMERRVDPHGFIYIRTTGGWLELICPACGTSLAADITVLNLPLAANTLRAATCGTCRAACCDICWRVVDGKLFCQAHAKGW